MCHLPGDGGRGSAVTFPLVIGVGTATRDVLQASPAHSRSHIRAAPAVISRLRCGRRPALWTAVLEAGSGCHGGPVTTPELASVPVRSSLALTRRWVTLLAPPVFGARRNELP